MNRFGSGGSSTDAMMFFIYIKSVIIKRRMSYKRNDIIEDQKLEEKEDKEYFDMLTLYLSWMF